MKWTNEQQTAIDTRNSNLLVAAAAGSGKTAVLVERIIQIILKDKIDIDRLLIVTFTNAAAGEMRERIAKAIVKELEKEDENEAHLRRQMTLLNKASITTLHSFCIEVVKKHFHLIDIDPGFRIGDITENSILQLEAIEELLESEYEKNHPVFIELVEKFGGNREDTPLQDLILKVYRFIQSQPKPYKWLSEQVEAFNIDMEGLEKSIWLRTIKKSIIINLQGAVDLLKEARDICNKANGPYTYLEAIEDDLRQIPELIEIMEDNMAGFYEKIADFKHKNLSRKKQEVDEYLKKEAQNLRNKAKDIISGIKNNIFLLSPEEYLEDLQGLYPTLKYLYQLVMDFGNLYTEKKNEKGIVDFNDLEHYALRILENEKAAKEYMDRFHYIFIDEYQDSNIVQETLINYIKREDNLFMVGDVKQSIYRFRLADPTLFIDKYENFRAAEGSANRRIDLSKNFRSRNEVLDAVNFIFKHIMTKNLGEIDYTKEAYLYPGREFEELTGCLVELNLIDKDFEIEEDLDEEIEELQDIEVEARIVAKRIKDLLKEEIYDPKTECYRKIEYKDIVVLMRTTQNWAEIFLETFLNQDIPAYADANTGYFQAVEVNMFMNLLKIIDNKRQDLPLLSVMRSPLANFTVEELIDIRTSYREGSFFEAIEEYIKLEKNDLTIKLEKFILRLNHWAKEARFMKTDEFIWKLLMDTGYFYYIAAMPGGLQRQANLRILLDRANQFENTSIKGLFNFIKFIEKLERSKGDMGAAKILGENDNVVRIMSIHKSKGLEFPVVITAGLGKKFNLRDVSDDVLLHKDLGLGPKFTDLDLRTNRDTIAKLAMKDKIKTESLSEEMRILYVALTRAVDKLILVGSVGRLVNQVKKWSKNISPYMLYSAQTYIDWIGTVVTKHNDGEPLRALAEIEMDRSDMIVDDSKWAINILNRRDILLEEQEKADKLKEMQEKLDNPRVKDETIYNDRIQKVLNWDYPYEKATNIPSKLSVTEIKKSNINNIESINYNIPSLVEKPKFLEGTKTFTPEERGTILHFVLQHLDLNIIRQDIDSIKEQIDMMIIRELLTEEEAEIVDVSKIKDFFNSKLGSRILNSSKVYREVDFNIKKKAEDIIKGLTQCDESLLVQGSIDCYFEEEDGLVLVDYKSDRVMSKNLNPIISRYDVQLELYKEALEKITGKKVVETYLYLFDVGKEVRIH